MDYQTYETEMYIYTYGFYCGSNANCKSKHLNNNTVIKIIASIKVFQKNVLDWDFAKAILSFIFHAASSSSHENI